MYYEIRTTAIYSGVVTVCIDYTGVIFTGQESHLDLYHYENNHWTPKTTTRDTFNHIICGDVTSLSPFAILAPNQAPTVDAGGPYSVFKGGTVLVSATGNDPEGDAITYTWDLDSNGTFETSGQSVTFSAATFSTGTHTIWVRATDHNGLSATDQATVSVIYNFSGFFQPVDNLPTLNLVKAGSAIPVKFSLGGDQGLNIFSAGYPSSILINCDTGVPQDAIEVTVTAGNSSLSYNATTDTYTYVWKTEKAWTGMCRQLVVRLNDGTDHVANFKFK
jgi:hypothetical protein